MSNSQQMKKGLSVRDLITTGILAALYMVCAMIGEAIFGFFPVLTFLCPLSIALLCGPVYMLILAKVPKHGPIIVTGILVGGVLFVLGMYWSMCLAYCILGVVADLLAGSGNFRNKGRNLLSYMIFVLSPVFSYGMLWFDRDAYVQYLVEKGTDLYGHNGFNRAKLDAPGNDYRRVDLCCYQRSCRPETIEKAF